MRTWFGGPAACILVLMCSACAQALPSSSIEQSQTALPPTVSLVGQGPIVRADTLGDYQWILPGAVTVQGGTYHAWMVGFGQASGDQAPFHLTSANGVDWQVVPGDLVAELGLALKAPGPIPTSVLVDGDGTWVMYLWGTPTSGGDHAAIWRATAPGPDGPWTAQRQPILMPGSSGAWDAMGVDFPSVVATADGYLMLFDGATSGGRGSIGAATSSDGITWTKHAGPAIQPGFCGAFDARSTGQARLLAAAGGGFVLVYGGFDETQLSVGMGRSSDGITWTCASPAPLLDATAIPGSTGIHTIAVADLGAGKAKVMVESLLASGSAVWLADLTWGS